MELQSLALPEKIISEWIKEGANMFGNREAKKQERATKFIERNSSVFLKSREKALRRLLYCLAEDLPGLKDIKLPGVDIEPDKLVTFLCLGSNIGMPKIVEDMPLLEVLTYIKKRPIKKDSPIYEFLSGSNPLALQLNSMHPSMLSLNTDDMDTYMSEQMHADSLLPSLFECHDIDDATVFFSPKEDHIHAFVSDLGFGRSDV
jgi:hypothetical protein